MHQQIWLAESSSHSNLAAINSDTEGFLLVVVLAQMPLRMASVKGGLREAAQLTMMLWVLVRVSTLVCSSKVP